MGLEPDFADLRRQAEPSSIPSRDRQHSDDQLSEADELSRDRHIHIRGLVCRHKDHGDHHHKPSLEEPLVAEVAEDLDRGTVDLPSNPGTRSSLHRREALCRAVFHSLTYFPEFV